MIIVFDKVGIIAAAKIDNGSIREMENVARNCKI